MPLPIVAAAAAAVFGFFASGCGDEKFDSHKFFRSEKRKICALDFDTESYAPHEVPPCYDDKSYEELTKIKGGLARPWWNDASDDQNRIRMIKSIAGNKDKVCFPGIKGALTYIVQDNGELPEIRTLAQNVLGVAKPIEAQHCSHCFYF